MREVVSCISVLILPLLIVVLYYQYRKFDIGGLRNEVEILRTSLSLEGIFFGMVVIIMAYSPKPNTIIIVPIFGFFLVLLLRIVQIEDIEKKLRENCEQAAREQMAEWHRK